MLDPSLFLIISHSPNAHIDEGNAGNVDAYAGAVFIKMTAYAANALTLGTTNLQFYHTTETDSGYTSPSDSAITFAVASTNLALLTGTEATQFNVADKISAEQREITHKYYVLALTGDAKVYEEELRYIADPSTLTTATLHDQAGDIADANLYDDGPTR